MNTRPDRLALELAALGVAQVATEEMLAAQLGLRTVEQIKENCWPECLLAGVLRGGKDRTGERRLAARRTRSCRSGLGESKRQFDLTKGNSPIAR